VRLTCLWTILTGCLFLPAAMPNADAHPPGQTVLGQFCTERSASRCEGMDSIKSIVLPISPELIDHVQQVPGELLAEDTLLIQGSDRDGRFKIDSVSPATERTAPMRVAMPMRNALLPQLQMRVFGAEERVSARLDKDHLDMQCQPGTQPAGVILSAPWSLPMADTALVFRHRGQGQFELLAADAALAAKESGVRIGVIESTPAAMDMNLRLPLTAPAAGLERGQWRHFSIACGSSGGALHLTALRLEPVPAAVPPRSRWQWSATEWRTAPGSVLDRAVRHGVRVLFVAVPFSQGRIAEPDALASFIRLANARGIDIWSVDGDPRMVLPSEHADAVQRVRAYAAYNARHPLAKLAGVQFDVEPYLMQDHAPGQAPDPSAWDQPYLELVRKLSQAAAGLPLEMVVPFWWADKADFLATLAPHVTSLNVMDYRTRHDEIYRFAAPFLDWGVRHHKKIRIALEAGPVKPEHFQRYARSGAGTVWLLKSGPHTVLLQLKEALPNPSGPAFQLAGSWVADGTATSFMHAPQRMLEMLPALEREFAAWPSFDGMALHELQ
jgi:hypothetical protein